MNFVFLLIITLILVIASGIILAMKAFFPNHRKIALVLYVTSWIFFLWAVSKRIEELLTYKQIIYAWVSVYWIHGLFLLLIMFFSYILFVLFPLSRNEFVNKDFDEIIDEIIKDREILFELNKSLKEKFDNLETDFFVLDLKKNIKERKEKLEEFWFDYIEKIFKIRMLRNKYRTFFVLDSTETKNLYKEAFLNGYYAFTMQHFYTLILSSRVRDKNMKTFLNQDNRSKGFSIDMFDRLTSKLTNFSELLRLNMGRLFYKILKRNDTIEEKIRKDIDGFLKNVDKNMSFYARLIIVKPLNVIEGTLYKLWYPIQKSLAVRVSKIKITLRQNHINEKLIRKYKNKFKPCDVFLERREWCMTNIGIPGFWTHSALYLGTLEELDVFFRGIKKLKGMKFSEYLEINFPKIYKDFNKKDEHGFNLSTLEAIKDGVIFTSLEYTASVDSLVVLRVKQLSKEQRLEIILNAFKYHGTPYDFNFSFAREDGLLCSELVYKSFQEVLDLGLDFTYINGEPIITPNMFAKKFANEYHKKNSKFKLVLFLDGDEKEKIAHKKGEKEFLETWERPSWHVVKDYF